MTQLNYFRELSRHLRKENALLQAGLAETRNQLQMSREECSDWISFFKLLRPEMNDQQRVLIDMMERRDEQIMAMKFEWLKTKDDDDGDK